VEDKTNNEQREKGKLTGLSDQKKNDRGNPQSTEMKNKVGQQKGEFTSKEKQTSVAGERITGWGEAV